MKNARGGAGVEFQLTFNRWALEVNANGKVSGVKMVRALKWANRMPKAVGGSRDVAGSEHVVRLSGGDGVWFSSTAWNGWRNAELDCRGRIIAPERSDNAFQTSNLEKFAGGDIVRGSDLVVTRLRKRRKSG